MRRGSRFVLVLFFSSLALLAAGVVFFWQYRAAALELRAAREGATRDFAARLDGLLSAGDDRAALGPAQQLFQASEELLLLAIIDGAGNPLSLQSRLDSRGAVEALSAGRGLLRDRRAEAQFSDRTGNEVRYRRLALAGALPGAVLLVHDASAYDGLAAVHVRRFAAVAGFVLLVSVLLLLLLARLERARDADDALDTDDAPGRARPETMGVPGVDLAADLDDAGAGAPHAPPISSAEPSSVWSQDGYFRGIDGDGDDDSQAQALAHGLAYLQTRNMQLEREVEDLAACRELGFEAAAKGDLSELVAYGTAALARLLLAADVRFYVDAARCAGDARPEGLVRVAGRRLARALARIADAPLGGGRRLSLPVTAGGTVYGWATARRTGTQRPFDETAVRRFSQGLAQLAVPLNNCLLYDMAVVDGLTGLFTRRHFEQRLREELERAGRYGKPLSLVLLDIDHFKRVNDEYGHPSGDRVLRGTAATLKRALRKTDYAFRYGGEEMAMLLPETPLATAVETAERLRAAVAAARFTAEDGRPVPVTASFGVAAFSAADRSDTAESLVSAADAALYFSKHNGRDMVSRHEPGRAQRAPERVPGRGPRLIDTPRPAEA